MERELVDSGSLENDLLDACASEPIHVPGSIQPHGHLVAVNRMTGRIVFASEQIHELTGWAAGECLGRPLENVLGEYVCEALKDVIEHVSSSGSGESIRVNLDQTYDVVAHECGRHTIIEFERVGNTVEMHPRTNWPAVNRIVDRLKSTTSESELCDRVVEEVRALTGFARVKVYRFDEAWNGEVVSEARADHMESYLNLHFPASDIPEQARKLYALNRIRLIPDVSYEPVTIVGESGSEPLDLSHSVLRSVSPVHIEYLRNMKVGASMSVSIMRDDRLWGLIACHHDAPFTVPYPTRSICGLVADLMGFLIASRQEQEDASLGASISVAQRKLLEAIVRSDGYVETLVDSKEDLLRLCRADGAAIITEDGIQFVGVTPAEDVIRSISDTITGTSTTDVFESSQFSRVAADAPADALAAGVLSIVLSRVGGQQIIWFRKEVAREVTWAGNPEKAVHERTNGTSTLHPRASFERWKSLRRGQSRPWRRIEVEAADALRRTIVDVALVRANRLARLNDRLGEANDLLVRRNRELQEFTYVASHDLQEPLRKIRSFANLLRDEYSEAVDDTAGFYLSRMESSAEHMSVLLHNLIEYASLAETPSTLKEVDLNRLVGEVARSIQLRLEDADARLNIDDLPTVRGEARRIQRMFECVLDNAVKFADDDRPLRIDIRCTAESTKQSDGLVTITVSDTGVGFDQHYANRVLRPFEQVHARDQYGGTGIGLALVRRIAEQHGGSVAITSESGVGTSVAIRLPKA